MSLADDVLARYSNPTPRDYRPEEDEFVNSILDKYTRKVSEPEESIFSKGLGAVGSVLGAPKAGIDYLARAGARAQGMNVPDTATTGSMMRNALGFNQGYETSGYGDRLAGKAVEFGTDLATDPVTWAMGTLGGAAKAGRTAEAALGASGRLAPEALGALVPEAATAAQRAVRAGNLARPVQSGAHAAFTGMMGLGALHEGQQLANTYQKEGFSPKAAEEALGFGLSAGGAALSAAHYFPSEHETVAKLIRSEPPERLQARLESYARKGKTELADLVQAEMDSRTAQEPSASPVVAPEGVETALRAAEAQSAPVATPRTSTMPEGLNASWIEEIAKATEKHPVVEAATPEEAKLAVDEVAGPAESAVGRLYERLKAQQEPQDAVPESTQPVSPERSVSPVEGDADAIAGRDPGRLAAPEEPVVEPTGIPTPAPDVVRQPETPVDNTLPFPAREPNPQRVALEAEVLRQRPNLDREMVKRVFDEVEEGKRPVEATVNALLKMDPRHGPAPFRGWEGHMFDANADQPSSLPPEKQAALKGVVENAPPEATDWIKESNAAAKAAEEARTGRQEAYDESKAKTQAERESAAEELAPVIPDAESASVGAPTANPKPLTIEDVQANFKGYKVTEGPDGFTVSLPGGRTIRVEHTGHIDLNPEALERGHGKGALEAVESGTQRIVGSYRRIGPESIIQVADQGTLPHEVWHGFMDHVASPKERRIAEQEFAEQAKKEGRAVEEVAADSYRDYFNRRRAAEAEGKTAEPKGFIDRVWSKVYEFFRNAYRSILPNMEYIQEQLYKGKPWERPGNAETAPEVQYSTTPPPATAVPAVQGPAKPPATLAEKAIEGWKAGLVSGPGTILVANPLSNVGEAGVRGIEAAAAGPIDAALTHWFGGERTRFSGEAVKQAQGIIPRLPGAFKVLSDRLKNALNTSGKIEGKTGQIVRVPFALLDAGDATTAHVNEGVVSKGLAYREGQRLGKTAAEKAKIEQDLLQNPTADFTKQVNREVQRRQWKGDPEDPVDMIGKFNTFIQQHPLLQVVAPFVRTPGEIAKVAIQRSPLGIFKAVADVKSLKAAIAKGASPETVSKLKGEAADSISRAMVGTTILGAFAAYAKAGGMTGSGPTDQKQKSLLRETGWQPYSFVVNANGKKAYIPFNRFEPVSTILGLSADLAEAKDQKNGEEVANKVIGSIASNITSKTYLQGIADAAEFINDPMKAGKNYLSSLTASLVPNIVAKTAQAIDPTLRDVTPQAAGAMGLGERLGKTVLSRLPGASMTLPARESATGEEIERPGNALSRFLSPIQVSQEKGGTGLEKALVDIGYVPSQPSRELKIPGKNVKVRLTDSEYNIVQQANTEAAKYLRQNLAKLKSLPKDEQEKAARKVFDRARESAKNKLFASPSFRARAKSEVENARQS